MSQGTQAQRPCPRRARYAGAASYLGIPVATLYALVSQGRVPHYRLGKRFVVFDLDDLDRWLQDRKVE